MNSTELELHKRISMMLKFWDQATNKKQKAFYAKEIKKLDKLLDQAKSIKTGIKIIIIE